MAKVDQLSAVIADINDATNRVAAKVDAELATIQALQAKLSSGTGVDPAELDPVLANLESVRNRLQGIGADPTNPVPEQPEAVTDQPTTESTTEAVGSAPAETAPAAAGSTTTGDGAID